jgi:hypothetical protein
MSKKVLTHSMDVPKDTTRWYVKKTREDTTGSFSSSLYSYRQTKNAVSETTTTDLPNGKTRIIIKHKWNTQADLDGYLTLLTPYQAERDAYHAANNIDYTETVTEE